MRRVGLAAILFIFLSTLIITGAAAQQGDLAEKARALHMRQVAARERALRLAQRYNWPVGETLPNGQVYSIQSIQNGMPQYYATCNANAAASTRANLVHPYIGGANGFLIGIWDGGKVRTTHREFTGRATWMDIYGSSLSDHSTHVAGTLIATGVHLQAKGMAYQADLNAYNWDYDEAEMAAEAAGGLTLSNHSYSYIRGWYENIGIFNPGWYWYGDSTVSETEDYHFGFYDSLAMNIDTLANAAPDYLIVVAASNDRGDNVPVPGTEHYYYHYGDSTWKKSTKVRDPDGGLDGFDCLPNGKQVAKNTLAVGAVEDVLIYTGPVDVVMTGFSSWGPTDDGRIKPDLVGNGWELYSCVATDDSSYFGGASGTSMASPNVCGSLALLQFYYQSEHAGTSMKASTLKALAIHTTREAGPNPGPDYMFGWGLLDTWAAYNQISDDLDDGKGLIEELTLNEGSPLEYYYWCDGTAPEMRVTICWSDPPGVPAAPGVDPPNIMLVNDLDLRVLRDDDTEYEPWRLDPAAPANAPTTGDNFRDNVEQVVIDTPAEGWYIVRIDHKSDLDGGAQDFSMIVSEAERVGIWHVYEDGSGDAPDITSAVASAAEGDLIYVYPGTYEEHDITIDKTLLVKGVTGRENTIVDAQSLGRCFYFNSSSGDAALDGFTLRNGLTSGSSRGAGLSCLSPDVTIRSCTVENCQADYAGGMHFSNASATVEDCIIKNCTANDYGGGMYLYFASPTFDHCIITGNGAVTNGGGVSCYESSPVFTNCTISHNDAGDHGGGIYIGYNSHPEIVNTVVSFSTDGEGIYGPASAIPSLTASCCDVYGNADGNYGGAISNKTGIDGNISEDPLYCDAAGGDYGLQGMSPCLPGGNPCGVYIGALGLACHTRSLWYVEADGSGDAPTIQAAVDSAIAGDTVLVAAGTYTGTGNRNIRTYGKPILIASESGRDVTIIDCSGAGDFIYGFHIWDNEDTTTVIRGLTITGATHGGILLDESGPIIEDCLLTGNIPGVSSQGSGIQALNSTAVIRGCIVSDDSSSYDGGGILCYGSGTDISIENCTLSGNGADHYGGGIAVKMGARAEITGCTISGNLADEFGGGLYIETNSEAILENCTIEGNTALAGGGVDAYGTCTISETAIHGNNADVNGGGIYSTDSLTLDRCTIVENSATGYASGVFCAGGITDISRVIVAFNTTDGSACGIYTNDDTLYIACSDVYGNDNNNYGGGISDQTGTNNNISQDPLFCDQGSHDYYIFDDSPCAPDHSPCGELIGVYGVNCYGAPDLAVTGVDFSAIKAPAGSGITAEITIKNLGASTADSFYVEFYNNRSVPPGAGSHGNQRLRADSLAVGDSLIWITDPVISSTIAEWSSYIQLDSDNYVIEKDEDNNIDGPHDLTWYAPMEGGWPVAAGGDFHSSPALADIDDDPRTLEVIIGCDDGKLYAWTADGDTAAGYWPVDLGAPILSSPAVGNITGDYRMEIVVGCDDGNVYALDHTGDELWHYTIGEPVTSTPALADFDGDGLLDVIVSGIVIGGAPYLYAIKGTGNNMPGAWPVKLEGTDITSAAVGDADDDGSFEIAVATSGITKPAYHSNVYLFDDAGAAYSASWPVAIDTAVVASPVMGDIAGAGSDLEIIVGALSGEVFAIALDGTIWPNVPRVPGSIERSPALVYEKKSQYQFIAVASRYWQTTMPPFGNWHGAVTQINNTGGIVSGWPNTTGMWSTDYGAVPSPINICQSIIAGSSYLRLYDWNYASGSPMPAFPRDVNRRALASPAAGDIDGDGWLEVVHAGSPDSVYCFEFCSASYPAGELHWPMFRNDRTRMGCFFIEEVSGIGDEPEAGIPAFTRLHSIFPNPFNPTTRITFGLHRRERVRIAVYDVAGRLVDVITDRVMETGVHEVVWNGRAARGRAATSGIYFCRMTAGDYEQTRKMVLLR